MNSNLTNCDIRGVYRGMCQKSQCECTGYIRKSDNAAAVETFILCLYCGHPPTKHASLSEINKISNAGMYIHIFFLQ